LRRNCNGTATEADVSEPNRAPRATGVPGSPAPERRCCERYPFRRQPLVRYLVRPSFEAGRAFLRDLSPYGLSLLVIRPLDPGAVLFVQLRGARRGVTHTQLARVVHVTEQSPGRWLVGCEFTCPLGDEQFRHGRSEGV
jgi:hypothetical protein